jgi:hypothetical protein
MVDLLLLKIYCVFIPPYNSEILINSAVVILGIQCRYVPKTLNQFSLLKWECSLHVTSLRGRK